ncbi:MAG: hypothetical protein ACKOKF_07720 [Bacteroidota bacterium]
MSHNDQPMKSIRYFLLLVILSMLSVTVMAQTMDEHARTPGKSPMEAGKASSRRRRIRKKSSKKRSWMMLLRKGGSNTCLTRTKPLNVV